MKEAEMLSKLNPKFRDYATRLFNENPEIVKKLYNVYLSKEVSGEELQDAFRAIALYSLMHFEKLVSFPQISNDKTTNKDVAAFVFSEGAGSRLSLLGLNTEKAMLEVPSADGFSPLVQLAYADLGANGLRTVLTTSGRTSSLYRAIFGNNDNVILTEEPGSNKYRALAECIKSLGQVPNVVFRTCADTLRCRHLLKLGIEKQLGLPNPEDYIVILARNLDKTRKNGLSSVSVKTDGDVALNFTKSPSIREGDDRLLYKVGSLIGRNMIYKLMDAGDVTYNTFCNNMPQGRILLVAVDSSQNKGIDDVFDLQDYVKETQGIKSLYDAVKARYRNG